METIIARSSSTIAGMDIKIVGTETHRIFLCFSDLCKALGLNLQRQQKRIQEKDIYSDHYEFLLNEAAPDGPIHGEPQLYLDYEVFPYWLLYLRAKSVKAELRGSLISIQRKMIDATGKKFLDSIIPPEMQQQIFREHGLI